MSFTLSDEQRRILRNAVRNSAQRNSADGRYYLYTSQPFDSLEELEAHFTELCIGRKKVPLSLFHDLRREQEVNAKVDQYERRQSLTLRRIKPKAADSYQHLRDMGKRLAWKDE